MGRHLDPNEVISELGCDGIIVVSELLCRQSLEKASKGPVELDEYPPTLCVSTMSEFMIACRHWGEARTGNSRQARCDCAVVYFQVGLEWRRSCCSLLAPMSSDSFSFSTLT